ncbi:MAG: hypothetical protein IJA69_04730 [Clostridia bacterium]|nr:hypothetical protein [Clostridia bacterium]
MKIDNSRIFVCDIYDVQKVTQNVICEIGDTSFGSYDVESTCFNHNRIVVEMEKGYYVPIGYIKNAMQYYAVKMKGYDKSFWLSTDKTSLSRRYVSNLKPYSMVEGKTELKQLFEFQQRLEDLTYEGGMEC